MAPATKYKYDELLERARKLIESGEVTNVKDLAIKLKIDRTTLMSGFFRAFKIENFDGIMKAEKPEARSMVGMPRTGTPIPNVSLGGSYLIEKSVCKPLVNGARYSPYNPAK